MLKSFASRELVYNASFKSFDGKSIAVLHGTLEPERGTTIIILPFGLNISAATTVCARFAPYTNVISWQGRSLHPDPLEEAAEALTPLCHVKDLETLLKWSGAKSCNLVGFCSGAGIALLASRNLARQVDRMVLICGEYMLNKSLCSQSSFQSEVDRLLPLAAQAPETADVLSQKLSTSLASRDHKTEFDSLLAEPFLTGTNLYRHGVNYANYREMDFLAIAGETENSTLLISTNKDEQVPPEASRLIARVLPALHKHSVFSGDHYEFLRGNSGIIDAVQEFLVPAQR